MQVTDNIALPQTMRRSVPDETGPSRPSSQPRFRNSSVERRARQRQPKRCGSGTEVPTRGFAGEPLDYAHRVYYSGRRGAARRGQVPWRSLDLFYQLEYGAVLDGQI